MRQLFFKIAISWLLLTGGLISTQAQCWFLPPGGVYRYGLHQVSVTPNYAEAADAEGVVWMDDRRVAVGYNGYLTGQSKNGSIRFYQPVSNLLIYQSLLRPPEDSYGLSRFGRFIASSGSFLAATYVLPDLSGSVAVYEATTSSAWTLRAQLRADNPREDDGFGVVLAMQGEWLTVIDLGFLGGIYIFKRNEAGEWSKHERLALPEYALDRMPDSGITAMMAPGVLAIGQPFNQIAGFVGKVHFWRLINGTWEFDATIGAPDAASGDRFGESISLIENRIAVGATRHNVTGTVYLFKRENGQWQFESKVPSPTTASNFGQTVSLSPDGSYLGAGNNTGYHFFRPSGNSWEHAGSNGGGNFFPSWESPAGTIRDYNYGTRDASGQNATQKGNQAIVKFRDSVNLLELGTHAVRTRHMTNAESNCIWIPIGYTGNGPSSAGSGDQDNDGKSDVAEAYFGTYFDTYNTLVSGLKAERPVGGSFTIQWPHSLLAEGQVNATPEWSSDLFNWSNDGIQVTKVGEEPEAGREILQATFPEPAGKSAFFRLRISVASP